MFAHSASVVSCLFCFFDFPFRSVSFLLGVAQFRYVSLSFLRSSDWFCFASFGELWFALLSLVSFRCFVFVWFRAVSCIFCFALFSLVSFPVPFLFYVVSYLFVFVSLHFVSLVEAK